MSHRRVDGREDDMVKSMAIASYGDALKGCRLIRRCQGLAYEYLSKSG